MIAIGCFLIGLAVVETVQQILAKRQHKKHESTWELFTKGTWK